MKKNAIGNIYSCFNKDGKLKNQKMFTAEVHKLISDGDFNTAFDFIITSKTPVETLQFIDGLITMGLDRSSTEMVHVLTQMVQSNEPQLRNIAPLVQFELVSKK